MGRFESKNTILTKKLNNVVYELLVKSSADMVYTDENTTLTDTLSNITDILTNHDNSFIDVMRQLTDICGDISGNRDEIGEIWNFLNGSGGSGESLAQLLENKVDKEEGKGLSQFDFTEFFRDKLLNDYTKEELDAKFGEMIELINAQAPTELVERVGKLEQKKNIVMAESEDSDEVEALNDGDIWFNLIDEEELGQ